MNTNGSLLANHPCWFAIEYGSGNAPFSDRDADGSYDGARVKYNLPCYPEEISDTVSTSWNDNEILGSTAPASAYASTGDRNVSFSFDLHREMTNNMDEIDNILRVLRSAAYPYYQSSGVLPPIVTFKFGEFKVRGKLQDVGYSWKLPINKYGQYSVCSVSISIKSSAIRNGEVLDTVSVRKGYSMNPFEPR